MIFWFKLQILPLMEGI